MTVFKAFFALILSFLICNPAFASSSTFTPKDSWVGIAILSFFVIAYIFVLMEEKINLRKSKPVTVAAGIIWILVIFAYSQVGKQEEGLTLLRHSLIEYSELMLFLLAAMTYVNSMENRGIFNAMRVKLINKKLSLRSLFWACGVLAFVISPIADNLTTSLILGAVCLAVGAGNKKFITLSLINIVVAANAGGAFSPFGDITTLMVWQKGHVDFFNFFHLFFPALVSWLIPAFVMSLSLTNKKPKANKERFRIKTGGKVITVMFISTISMTVALHQTLHIPPFLSMVTGLGFLKLYGFFIRRQELKNHPKLNPEDQEKPFDIFVCLNKVEWDTLMFFYGVMMCVGGIGAMGYLTFVSEALYGNFGSTITHIFVGFLSSIIDNIPVMFAVLNMEHNHSLGQWLLVTLTAGIGGSLLSIGSAAGVALMGQARGTYTFFGHLKWSWIILIGYLAGIGVHMLINDNLF